MKTVRLRKELNAATEIVRASGKSIGFVPTMGALHEGHAALVRRARAENDLVVASIFVNPTQFNNASDLAHYPRTPEADTALLESCGCDLLFMPVAEEMYPSGLNEAAPALHLGSLATVMEAAHRPGHFEGVTLIVKKLFEAVGSCNAYFGEKDFQQLAVIRHMVKELALPVHVIGCPIVREADGLAMSSRNVRLTSEERAVAPLISHTLFNAKVLWPSLSAEALKESVVAAIEQEPLLRLEYIEIADRDTLLPVQPDQKDNAVACIAVHLGAVRLIDNILL